MTGSQKSPSTGKRDIPHPADTPKRTRLRPDRQELLIIDGLLFDPALGRPMQRNVVIRDGRVADLTRRRTTAGSALQAENCWVCPGFVDMHVHLREPGGAHKETIASGLAAALRGGFTAVAAMPNTNPPVDTPETLNWVVREGRRANAAELVPVCRISRSSAPNELVDMEALTRGGGKAFSNDGAPVEPASLMALAMAEAARLGVAVLDHCEDSSLTRGGVMHPGPRATGWGLPGLTPVAEELHVARDILLAADSGFPVHLCHLSTARSVDLLRWGLARGAPVTAEVCPHHFALAEEAMPGPDPDYKMNPPLRTHHDVEAILAALRDATVGVIATDHAPHAPAEKAAGFCAAPFGVVGLETAVALCLDRLVHQGVLDAFGLVRALAVNPARILGIEPRGLTPGSAAHVTILAPERPVVVDRDRFRSLSRNTPFQGMRLRGGPVATLVRGQVKYHENV